MVYLLIIEERKLENGFLLYCIDNSAIDTGAAPADGEKILTLSTCTGSGHARRRVVQEYFR